MQTTEHAQSATAQTARPPGYDEFSRLYLDSRDDLFAYLAFLVGDRSLAEELTADAFERAFRKRALFNRGRGELRGWLFRIARNNAVDELRRSQRESALALPEVDAGVDSANVVDDRLLVEQALKELRPRERELIALKFFAGLENDQIARVLKISRSNAGTQLHRAMSRLRDVMGEREDV